MVYLTGFSTIRRFSKEQLAKYYCSWSNRPYAVKKGGEKIFRYFIEELTGEGEFLKPIIINRDFYEDLISKIILFRSLEKIYGQGTNSMGQLRSAVVPYTLSIIYMITDGDKKAPSFDLLKIWINEGLENDLETYLAQLLKLVNELIKKYSASDDYGEYSKKVELWNAIITSSEINEFIRSSVTSSIIDKYGISKSALNIRKGQNETIVEVDFNTINDNILIHSNGVHYYKAISKLTDFIDDTAERCLTNVISCIINKTDLDQKLLDFEKRITRKLRIEYPVFFDKITIEPSFLYETLNFVTLHYNMAISNSISINSEFEKIEKVGSLKGVKYSSVFSEIGRQLSEGIPPSIRQVILASHFINRQYNQSDNYEKKNEDISSINESVLRKIVEWDSKYKVLSIKQRTYISDFAYGLKKINPFHEKNLLLYYEKLKGAGFKE